MDGGLDLPEDVSVSVVTFFVALISQSGTFLFCFF